MLLLNVVLGLDGGEILLGLLFVNAAKREALFVEADSVGVFAQLIVGPSQGCEHGGQQGGISPHVGKSEAERAVRGLMLVLVHVDGPGHVVRRSAIKGPLIVPLGVGESPGLFLGVHHRHNAIAILQDLAHILFAPEVIVGDKQ